jgi:hypothetical protein
MDLCNDKKYLKEERVKAKNLKQNIVGIMSDDYNKYDQQSHGSQINEEGIY